MKRDKIEKLVLQVLLNHLNIPLTTRGIARRAQISPLTAKRKLDKFYSEGYVYKKLVGVQRNFLRKNRLKSKNAAGINVQSPAKILWTLRYNE